MVGFHNQCKIHSLTMFKCTLLYSKGPFFHQIFIPVRGPVASESAQLFEYSCIHGNHILHKLSHAFSIPSSLSIMTPLTIMSSTAVDKRLKDELENVGQEPF